MSVPTRDQSGSRFSSRIQVCRSVKPGGKGVPPVIGLGADSQRKSPLLSSTCGTKKYWSASSVSGSIINENISSWPVTRPSPPVNWFGNLWIPFTTEFNAEKLELSTVVEKLRVPAPELRSLNSTSEGELTRVSTPGPGGSVESF